ncbi:MAG: SLBB domain-containing protein [Gammaproteobacteria bacterium]|nr:MAG: SLBB domain-containing protein [Gammaproteobacteria bacterium]
MRGTHISACGPVGRILTTLLVTALLPLLAAAQTSSGGALEIFQSMSPEQQRAVLESLQENQDGQSDSGFQSPEMDNQRLRLPQPSMDDQRMLMGKPRIQPKDTVLLDLRLTVTEQQKAKPVAAPPMTGGALPQAGADQRAQPAVEPAPEDPVRAAQAREDMRRRALQLLPEDQIKAFEAAEELRRQAMAANPYQLDRYGQLWIPGLPAIALAGLTEEQATERLAREPAMELLTVKVTLLNLQPLGVESLKPFGYDVFAPRGTTFQSGANIPIPAEYVVGPGDTLELQLLGNTKGKFNLVVSRDGDVRIPEIGPVTIAGLTFPQAQDAITNIVSEQMIGTRAVVTMGRLRSARVLVTGEAKQPGTYTVGGLATITNVLGASGGVKDIGSLRNIELKRNGKLVSRLDLYDVLLHGDTSDDARVLSGDVVFIPPVGRTAGVLGEIRRPATYEIQADTTAGDLVTLGGGLTPEANAASARIERIDPQHGRIVVNVDLTTEAGRSTPLRSGDVLRLDPVRPTMVNSVTLRGHVHRPGSFQYQPGMRLSDLIGSVDDLRPNADLHYVLIRRETGPELRVSAVSADLAQAWAEPGSDADIALAPRDEVTVFDMDAGRERLLAPIVAELDRQGTRSDPPQTVGVGGRVRMPGQYPLEPGMTIADLVRAGGSLDEAAFGGEAELTRYEVVNGNARETVLIEIDLARALAGDPEANIDLQPFDFLVIKELSQWTGQESVLLEGEIRFPGRYPIKRGETLASALNRAGGLTDLAFVEGSVFTRTSLKEREARQLEQLTNRMQRDLAALSVQTSQVSGTGAQSATQALIASQALLDELRKSEPVGRLVIDLPRVMAAAPGSTDDVVLKDGDRLIVPRQTQDVTVIGEVQGSTSHLYDRALARDDYIRLSGGLTQKADANRIYIVRANGGVETHSGNRWFGKKGSDVRPGDTIVVPLDAERLPPLPLWTSVTTIIYNLAIAVAAVNSF